MKRTILLISIALLFGQLFAQAPQGINYQAVARNNDSNNTPMVNMGLTVGIKIKDAFGADLYTESHNVTTNGLGLFNLTIGQGSSPSTSFSNLNWASGSKLLEVIINGQSGGTQPLLSVPYALYAERAKTVSITNSSLLQDQSYGVTSTVRGSAWLDVRLSPSVPITQLQVPETGTYLVLANLKVTDVKANDNEFQLQVVRVNDNAPLIAEATVWNRLNSTTTVQKGELAAWSVASLTSGQLVRLQYRMIGNPGDLEYVYSHGQLALIKLQ